MDQSNCAIHAHIRKPEDYKILNDTPYKNSIVIKTELSDIILTIDGNVAPMMAMDLVKAIAAQMKQDVNQEIENLSLFES